MRFLNLTINGVWPFVHNFKLGTGSGQVFKDQVRAVSFEVYRKTPLLIVIQIENSRPIHKALYYVDEQIHHCIALDLETCKMKAYKEMDALID